MANVGYRRVSTKDQNPARQLIDVEVDEMFTDHYTGKTNDRPALNDCQRYLRKGDTLHVHSMDRLARNLIHLQKTVDDLVSREISVKFHKENLSFSGDVDPISRLVMQLIGAVAEMELSLIKERQREGIAAAKRAGKILGAKPKATPELAKQVIELLEAGLSKSAIAKHLCVARSTLYKCLPDDIRTKAWPHSTLTPKQQAMVVWEKLSKIPISQDRKIEKSFFSFKEGTPIFDVYRWIEKSFKVSIALDLIRKEDREQLIDEPLQ